MSVTKVDSKLFEMFENFSSKSFYLNVFIALLLLLLSFGKFESNEFFPSLSSNRAGCVVNKHFLDKQIFPLKPQCLRFAENAVRDKEMWPKNVVICLFRV